ncbi:hypothetical protein CPB84DRAFT_1829446 [Gymnopilus junonius]|uniref:Uncharacterized protein n=1 Tax=Gymnopilus junonius TaxID=109634 RepID=A0A9P5TFF6_GYMJU|nr:hypothetical protein CPB84DRAFT_1829446 [Gymnopilus junonius]
MRSPGNVWMSRSLDSRSEQAFSRRAMSATGDKTRRWRFKRAAHPLHFSNLVPPMSLLFSSYFESSNLSSAHGPLLIYSNSTSHTLRGSTLLRAFLRCRQAGHHILKVALCPLSTSSWEWSVPQPFRLMVFGPLVLPCYGSGAGVVLVEHQPGRY